MSTSCPTLAVSEKLQQKEYSRTVWEDVAIVDFTEEAVQSELY